MFVTHLASYLTMATVSRLLRVVTFFFASVTVLLASTVALAQSETDRATARNLAAEGYTALKTQDFATAEDRFRRADALVHAPTLVVDHARALIGLSRFVEAQERLELVLREGVPATAPWVWKKSIQDAEQLVGEVKPKVAWLTIYVTGPSEPLVSVDGVQVPVAALGVRRATDPGPRRISATAHGYLSKEVSVALPEGGERAVTLELSVDPGQTEAVVESKSKPKRAYVQQRNAPKPRSHALTYAAFGLSGVGVVVGAVTGYMFLGARSDLNAACPNGKCPSTYADYDDVHGKYITYGTISGASWTVGVLSGVTGIWLLLSNEPKAYDARAKRVDCVPYVTANSVGLVGAF